MPQNRKQQIEDMLRDEPGDAELRYMLAMEYISEGDDAGAARTFDELIRLTPDYPPAYHMAGRTLQRLRRIDEARALLERGIPVALARGDQHAAGEMQELLSMLE